MKGKKSILFVVIVAMSLIALLTGFFLIRAIKGLKDIEEDLQGARITLSNYYKKNPFPTKENITVEEKNVEILCEKTKKLLNELREGQVELGNNRSPSSFLKQLGSKRDDLLKLAAENGSTVPKEFSFGFERYFKKGLPPVPAAVPRLTQQLVIVEYIAKVLFKGKVGSIDGIEREKFEDVSSGKNATKSDSEVEQGERLFTKQFFVFEFSTKEKNLLKVLNRLVEHQVFVAVTSLSIKKRNLNLMKNPMFYTEREKEEDEEIDLEHLSREDRIVCGMETEKLVRVRMVLDVCSFKEWK
ncbi:hypothetical protein ACFLS1_00865 [Verrucomicrobiota bacterium]